MDDVKSNEVAFNMKVDETLKDEFKKATKANDSDASKEIRTYMKRYVNEHKPKGNK